MVIGTTYGVSDVKYETSATTPDALCTATVTM